MSAEAVPRIGLDGLNLHEMSLSPHYETDWSRIEGINCAEIFKLWSFLQSKYVNNVCKLLPLLRDFVRLRQTPLPGLSPWTSLRRDFRPQVPWATAPEMKIPASGDATACQLHLILLTVLKAHSHTARRRAMSSVKVTDEILQCGWAFSARHQEHANTITILSVRLSVTPERFAQNNYIRPSRQLLHRLHFIFST